MRSAVLVAFAGLVLVLSLIYRSGEDGNSPALEPVNAGRPGGATSIQQSPPADLAGDAPPAESGLPNDGADPIAEGARLESEFAMLESALRARKPDITSLSSFTVAVFGQYKDDDAYLQNVKKVFRLLVGAVHNRLAGRLKDLPPELLVRLAEAADAAGRYDLVKSDLLPFAERLEGTPLLPDALILLARRSVSLCLPDEASIPIERLLKEFPTHPLAAEAKQILADLKRKSGDTTTAIHLLEEALPETGAPSQKIDILHQLAVLHEANGDEAAATKYRCLLVTDTPESWRYHPWIREAGRSLDAALEKLAVATGEAPATRPEMSPDDTLTQNALTADEIARRQHGLLENDQTTSTLRKHLQTLVDALGRVEENEEWRETAFKVAELPGNDPEVVRAMLTPWLERFPSDPEVPAVLYRLATLIIGSPPDEQRNQEYLDRLLRDYPRHPKAALGRAREGCGLYQQKKYAEARNLLEAVCPEVASEPMVHAYALLNLGMANLFLGEESRAKESLRETVRLYADDPAERVQSAANFAAFVLEEISQGREAQVLEELSK